MIIPKIIKVLFFVPKVFVIVNSGNRLAILLKLERTIVSTQPGYSTDTSMIKTTAVLAMPNPLQELVVLEEGHPCSICTSLKLAGPVFQNESFENRPSSFGFSL